MGRVGIRGWLILLCAASVLFLLAGGLIPGSGRDAIKGWLSLGEVESAAHFVLCALIVLLAWLAYGSKWIFPLTVVALGALIEVLQFWVPGRSPSWSDFWVDCAGVITGMLVYWFIHRFSGYRRYG